MSTVFSYRCHDHSYYVKNTSVTKNCTHDHSYYVKNTSVTKNCTNDHSYYVKNTSVTDVFFTYEW
jgi:hypothetical protein